MRYPWRDLSLLILLLSLTVSLGWWKNENMHGSIWIQNDQELKALSLAEVGGGVGGGGVIPLYEPSNRYMYVLPQRVRFLRGFSLKTGMDFAVKLWTLTSVVCSPDKTGFFFPQVFIHPKSVNFQVNSFDSPFLVYHEKVKTSKVSISFRWVFISVHSVRKRFVKLATTKTSFRRKDFWDCF